MFVYILFLQMNQTTKNMELKKIEVYVLEEDCQVHQQMKTPSCNYIIYTSFKMFLQLTIKTHNPRPTILFIHFSKRSKVQQVLK